MSIFRKHADPTFIPLPLSPVQKPRLQSRRPGQRATSGRAAGETSHVPLADELGQTRQRSISGRIISLQPRSKPRRVSAAMQYALLPTPPGSSPAQSARDVSRTGADLSPTGTAVKHGSEDDDGGIPLLELDRSATSSRAPSGWVSQVAAFDEEEEEEEGSDQGQDENQEAWIDYVREQLSALFPDVYRHELVPPPGPPDATATISSSPDAMTSGPRIVSDASTSGFSAVSTQSSDMPVTPMYGDGAHELVAAASSGAAADHVTSRVLGNVVNVRDEIQAMREEMQRLRGVVGELSEGLRDPEAVAHEPATPRRPDVGIPEWWDAEDDDVDDDDDDDDADISHLMIEIAVPKEISDNVDLIDKIIRQLNANLPGSDIDSEAFERANLQHMLELLQGGTEPTRA